LYEFLCNDLTIDDPEYFKGAPISLQVVGRPWEDEKVLAAMQLIEDVLAA
jgi:Asp-tRNA(Asn)/Glu-tRNA(Gln) amidotransferase A subunit family amidase